MRYAEIDREEEIEREREREREGEREREREHEGPHGCQRSVCRPLASSHQIKVRHNRTTVPLEWGTLYQLGFKNIETAFMLKKYTIV